MDKKIVLFLFIVLLNTSVKAQAYIDSLNKQAKEMVTFFIKKDYNGSLKYTHPKVIELLGGEDKALEIVSNSMIELKKQNLLIANAEIGEIVQILATKKNIQCVIPQILEGRVEGLNYKPKNYLYGISYDEGKRWYFLDTAGRNNKQLRKMLPEINKDLVIPKSETTYN